MSLFGCHTDATNSSCSKQISYYPSVLRGNQSSDPRIIFFKSHSTSPILTVSTSGHYYIFYLDYCSSILYVSHPILSLSLNSYLTLPPNWSSENVQWLCYSHSLKLRIISSFASVKSLNSLVGPAGCSVTDPCPALSLWCLPSLPLYRVQITEGNKSFPTLCSLCLEFLYHPYRLVESELGSNSHFTPY